MRIYKKCPCCGKTMFLLLGSDFNNEVEMGSAFGSKDNIPHSDTNHEQDWECLNRFLTCLNNSHGSVYLSLSSKDRDKVPKEYKEVIMNWTEGGYKKEEGNNSSKSQEPKNPSNTPKTIRGWYESKQITYQDWKLLTTPWTEEEGDLYVREINLDPQQLFTWEEMTDYLKRVRKWEKQENQKKQREGEINRKMNDGKDWSNIHSDFKGEWGETYKKHWIVCGFTYQTCKEWINIGLSPSGESEDNASFCAWLRDKKRLRPEEILNKRNIKELRKEYESTLIYWG